MYTTYNLRIRLKNGEDIYLRTFPSLSKAEEELRGLAKAYDKSITSFEASSSALHLDDGRILYVSDNGR